jgi:hypothetical protein
MQEDGGLTQSWESEPLFTQTDVDFLRGTAQRFGEGKRKARLLDIARRLSELVRMADP